MTLTKSAVESRRADGRHPGGKYVARTGSIIASGFGRVGTEEHRAGIGYFFQQFGMMQTQVLGGLHISGSNGEVDIGEDGDGAALINGFAGDGGSGQRFQVGVRFRRKPVCAVILT